VLRVSVSLIFKLDLHIHSIYSKDSSNSIDNIIEGIKKLGLDGFALTDHDTLAGISEASKKKDDLLFIPALEVSAKNAHILVFDPIELVPDNLGIIETVEIIHEQGALAVLAHPFGLPHGWVNRKNVEKANFDAIEVANSAQFPYRYILEKNLRLANELGLPGTGGSDSHVASTIGKAYTLVESSSRDMGDILDGIKKGHTKWYGSPISFVQRIEKYFPKKENMIT
jgi:hypothetical protein